MLKKELFGVVKNCVMLFKEGQLCVGSITSCCAGNEPALLPRRNKGLLDSRERHSLSSVANQNI